MADRRLIRFQTLLKRYDRRIINSAAAHPLPGLDTFDIAQEMRIALYKAWSTWDSESGTPFAAYWWSVWLNRRTSIIRNLNAAKRQGELVLTDDDKKLELALEDPDLLPEPPTGSTLIEVEMWILLSCGIPPQDTQSLLGISKRHYYSIIHKWASDSDVLERLKGR